MLVAVGAVRRAVGAAVGERLTPVVTDESAEEAPASRRVEDIRSASRAPSVVVAEEPGLTRLPSGAIVLVRAVSTGPNGELAVPRRPRVGGLVARRLAPRRPVRIHLDRGAHRLHTQGLGPFAELLDVDRGARITVSSPSLRQEFAVARVGSSPREACRTSPGSTHVSGPRRLTLVTCAPPYVASEGGYQNLAVIVAYPTGGPERRRP